MRSERTGAGKGGGFPSTLQTSGRMCLCVPCALCGFPWLLKLGPQTIIKPLAANVTAFMFLTTKPATVIIG
jgi:hypothetical protein